MTTPKRNNRNRITTMKTQLLPPPTRRKARPQPRPISWLQQLPPPPLEDQLAAWEAEAARFWI